MPGTTKKDHQAERLQAIRLRYSINTHLEDRGITTPAAIGAAIGLQGGEVVRLLTRRQWREGDVAQLEAAAARLGVQCGRGHLSLLAPTACNGAVGPRRSEMTGQLQGPPGADIARVDAAKALPYPFSCVPGTATIRASPR